MNEQIELELKSLLNSRFSTSESTRANYARGEDTYCLLYTSPSPRDGLLSRMPSSA